MNLTAIREFIDRREILYLSEKDLLSLDVMDFRRAALLIEEVFVHHKRGSVVMPHSDYLKYANRSPYDRMVALLGAIVPGVNVSGLKLINSSTLNNALGLPRASGLLVLCEPKTQRIYCLLEASHISAVRTAALTGVAIARLGPYRIGKVAVLGCGMLARAHLRMWSQIFNEVRPEFYVFDTDPAKITAILKFASEIGVAAEPATSGEDAIRDADVIIPVTTSERPWIQGSWIRENSLYAAVSLLDAHLEVFRQADYVVVDDRSLCMQENRPLHILEQRGELSGISIIEIGDVIAGDKVIPRGGSEKVVFNPMGTVMTDLIVGADMFWRAIQQGRGSCLPV